MLVNGNIPPKTICPYVGKCEIAKVGACSHKGAKHKCEYSCAAARGFDAVEWFRARPDHSVELKVGNERL